MVKEHSKGQLQAYKAESTPVAFLYYTRQFFFNSFK